MIHNMTHEQLCALLDVLPMELAFIDAHDNVRFWNRTAERGPAWQPSALGKTAQQCHKQASVAAVNKVLDSLKSGASDVVDRVVTADGEVRRFRWYAVRNDAGEYLGAVEMIQYGAEVSMENPLAHTTHPVAERESRDD
jgi:hypothetical protein